MLAVVFGGSGFLGSHVADALTETGHDVRIFDLAASAYLSPGQQMCRGTILDPVQVETAVCGADYVYNFAGIADLDDASTRPIDTAIQNIQCNINVMDACVKQGVKRFIYASTIYVHSDKGGFYRCSKQASELYIEEFQKRYGLDFTILRYGTLYGPRADQRNSIYRYLYQALNKKEIAIAGNGDERREYINVKDAARLSVDILAPAHANKRVTITGHQSIRFGDLISVIQEILNDEVRVSFSEALNGNHYRFTPYSFNPKTGYKLTTDKFTDLGQGLVECLSEMVANDPG